MPSTSTPEEILAMFNDDFVPEDDMPFMLSIVS
jgi:hypothetical protein